MPCSTVADICVICLTVPFMDIDTSTQTTAVSDGQIVDQVKEASQRNSEEHVDLD